MQLEEKLKEYLGREIMGWEKKFVVTDPTSGHGQDVWHDNGEPVFFEKMSLKATTHRRTGTWEPLENLEQTFEVLEEYIDFPKQVYDLKPTRPNYQFICDIYYKETPFHNNFGHRADTKPKAIIGAILKAESKLEEFEGVFE